MLSLYFVHVSVHLMNEVISQDTFQDAKSFQIWPHYEILTRLAEETVELAREVNHLYGTKKKNEVE